MPNLKHLLLVIFFIVFSFPQMLLAQSIKLPPASRTVYKCIVEGKVVYTDEPCVGAKRVDIEPTRGMNKSSGRELTGRHVSREIQTEQLAEAVKPITGLTAQQFELQRSRVHLPPETKSQCVGLDRSIAQTEAQEQIEPVETKPKIQRELFALRKRYRELRC